MRVLSPKTTTENCMDYPFWNELFTFSTGFSTGIVKKAPVFPRCFPLFPLSFPHFPVRWFIHGVLYRANLCENQGNYGPLHLFSERKSNPKIYFLQQAENTGISETLCSYHKTFIGAAQKKVLPKPKCIVYTNLTCDANLLTFKKLAKMYEVPIFAIDVPMQQNEDNVQYVSDQLRKLKEFIEECTGKKITDEALTERLRRSKRTLEKFAQYEKESADKYVPADLVTPLYVGMTNNLLLGTKEEEDYVDRLLKDVKNAPAKKGKKIYWMHTIPFWSDAVKNELCFQEKAQIVGCELSHVCEPDFDPENPFEAMAERMVYHSLNGSALRRIEAGIRHAKQAGADGAVWFGHWGCKHTLGAAQLAKKKFEEAGLPLLILDGDGCDRSHGGEGQTSTRLGAFLEMLGGAENE